MEFLRLVCLSGFIAMNSSHGVIAVSCERSIVYNLIGLLLARVVSLVVKADKLRSEVSSTKPKMGAHHADLTPEQ